MHAELDNRSRMGSLEQGPQESNNIVGGRWRAITVVEPVSYGFGEKDIEGRVWVVTDFGLLEPLPDRLPGTILAVPAFGWDNWFAHVGMFQRFDAIFSEGMTVLHHAAIIMREIGFVCCNVPDLFDQISNGDQVRIKVKRAGFQQAMGIVGRSFRYEKRLPSVVTPRDAYVELFVREGGTDEQHGPPV